MDFTLASFEELLDSVASRGYTFARFDAPPADASGGTGSPAAGRLFYLRHDVDLSALMAATMGEIEARHGVAASFFFQPGAETYNIFAPEVLDIMRRLRGLGHAVGLHVDQDVFSDDGDSVRRTVEWFGECVAEIDPVVSFHRPSETVLSRAFEGFTSAYETRFFGPDSYLSDSRRDGTFSERLVSWLDEGRSPVQLLLHPGWWYEEPDIRAFRDALVRRRSREVEVYLRDHMRKVFGEVVDDEDGAAGL